jgi:hypothetical protein
METPMLVIQDQSDANELIARRINVIYSRFDGGLGEFFDRLQQQQRECESDCETDKMLGSRLKAVAMRSTQSDCGDH